MNKPIRHNKQHQPVAIIDFTLLSSVGVDKVEIINNMLSERRIGMVEDTHYLQGRKTVIGKLPETAICRLPKQYSKFDFRANQVLAKAINDFKEAIDRLKTSFPAKRIGVIMATSTSGVESLEQALPLYDKNGYWPESYQLLHQRMANISAFLCHYLQLSGPAMTVSTACSSANKAFASAKRWLNAGLCDAVICGGVDVLSQLTLRGFESLGALSSTHGQPFSLNRCGINIGEGAALFVLTNGEAEFSLLGVGESSDGYHISAPEPSGNGASQSMQAALSNANLATDKIDYINLHGTGTLQNDPMEATAIHHVFAEQGAAIACSSSKAKIGHTLGVSGAIELGMTLLSMSKRHNLKGDYLPHIYDNQYDTSILPLNLVKPDNQLGRPHYALSNSFAFGGSNATLVIARNGD